MIEENNPEINVDKLMNTIREEVANHQANFKRILNTKKNANVANLISNITHIESLLLNAETRAYSRKKWPDKLNRFPFNLNSKLQKFILSILNLIFKDQREVNLNLIFALKESISLNRQLIEQIKILDTQTDERLATVDNRIQGIDKNLSTVNNSIQGIDSHLNTVDNNIQGIDSHLNTVDNNIQGIHEKFKNTDDWISNLINSNQERQDEVNSQIQKIDKHVDTIDARIQDLDERFLQKNSFFKKELTQQKHLITIFLEEARKHLSEPFNQESLQKIVSEEQHLLDTFYKAFEDKFRGSSEDIFNRLKVYLPLVKEAKIGTPDSPILDVGCGRGEWLELLREYGYTAQGIDCNRVMVKECKSKQLEVVEADVISFLRSLPDSSLGAVTGFHIIEHLPFEGLIKLVDEIMRVLNVGGLAIFESPNPENIIVGACNFYSDPTHVKPIFPATIKFILEERGFSNVQLMRLSEHRLKDPLQFIELDNPIAAKVNPLIEIAKSNFYASPDFAVIAKKY